MKSRLPHSLSRHLLTLALLTIEVAACIPPSEAPVVQLPVVVDHTMVTVFTNDAGYEIELERAQLSLGPIVFTTRGEAHVARSFSLHDLLIPSARAHPGHSQDGEIIGELPGMFTIDWSKEHDRELGTASLIASDYDGANFSFATPGASPESLPAPVSHTATLRGVARKQGRTISFLITIDAPEGRELTGAPFEATIASTATGRIAFRLHTVDMAEGDTLFDGVDFATLDSDEDGMVNLTPDSSSEAYNTLRRALLSHDHYSFEYRP